MPKPIPSEYDKSIKQAYLEYGQLPSEIASILHCHPKTINRRLISMGIKPRGFHSPTVKMPDDKAELGYIAGIMDGEGSFLIVNNGKTARVCVGNTCKPLIDRLCQLGGNITPYNDGIHKPAWDWHLCKVWDVYLFTKAILPYLIVKKVEAEMVLSHCKTILFDKTY